MAKWHPKFRFSTGAKTRRKGYKKGYTRKKTSFKRSYTPRVYAPRKGGLYKRRTFASSYRSRKGAFRSLGYGSRKGYTPARAGGVSGKNWSTATLGTLKYNTDFNYAIGASGPNAGGFFATAANADPLQLIAMLNQYNGNASEAAQRTHVHRNTFRMDIIAGPNGIPEAFPALPVNTPIPFLPATATSNRITIGAMVNRGYVRAYWFLARRDIPRNASYTDVQTMFEDLYLNQEGATSGDIFEPNFSPFMNSPWCELWKCVKSEKFQMGPRHTIKSISYSSKPYLFNSSFEIAGDYLAYGGKTVALLLFYQGELGISDGAGSGGTSTAGFAVIGNSPTFAARSHEEFTHQVVIEATDAQVFSDQTLKLRTGDGSNMTVVSNVNSLIN